MAGVSIPSGIQSVLDGAFREMLSELGFRGDAMSFSLFGQINQGAGASASYDSILAATASTPLSLSGNAAATSGVACVLDNQTAQTSGKIASFRTGGVEVADIDYAGSAHFPHLILPTGAAGTSGQATLASGTVTVSTTAVTASSIISLTYSGTPSSPGILNVGTITAGTNFVIHSSSGTDASVVNWVIIN